MNSLYTFPTIMYIHSHMLSGVFGSFPFSDTPTFTSHIVSLFFFWNHLTVSEGVSSLLMFADSSSPISPPSLGVSVLSLAPTGLLKLRKILWYLALFYFTLSHSPGKSCTSTVSSPFSVSVYKGWGSSPHLLRQDHTVCENLLHRHTSVSAHN